MLPVPFYILFSGIMLSAIIFLLITKQNRVLTSAKSEYQYTSYNHSKSRDQAAEIINFWQSNQTFRKAVVTIVYLDYAFMFIYGTTIFYGLLLCYRKSGSNLQALFALGLVLIVVAVLIDAIQDYSIYQHLLSRSSLDVRFLTRYKFGLLICSLVILVIGGFINLVN